MMSSSSKQRLAICWLTLLAACASDPGAPIVIELGAAQAEVTRSFAVDGERVVRIVIDDGPVIVEAWADGGAIAGVPATQLAAGGSAAWRAPAPAPATGELELVVTGDGEVTFTAWSRGAPVPAAVVRDRSLAWFDAALLDDTAAISFANVLAAIGEDGHGGRLLDRWFRAFAAGPGAGRAAFADFVDELAIAQGSDPAGWELAALPFKVTGVHNRFDLAAEGTCGELRISIASTHPTLAPVHLIFLFRQPATPDDATPDGMVHCRGTARRWARLTALDAAGFAAAARDVLAAAVTRERFLLAESVELSISPWQWRQWRPDGAGGLVNPPLFQTIDVARVNAPGATRDGFLAAVAANAPAIAARTWSVPAQFRAQIAEVQPSAQAPLVELSPLAVDPALPRALGMIGCPRCHTDDADFVHTSFDRQPSPFYDRELEARAARLDALGRGEWPAPVPFGPLQPL